MLYGYFHGYIKRNIQELPMTAPELKSTVYLLPEVAWPVIKQIVANTGNRLQCSELTSDTQTRSRPCEIRRLKA